MTAAGSHTDRDAAAATPRRWPEGNPGSREALAAGCICAVIDNCHGKFAPWPPDDWWITEGCPVHSPSAGDARV